MKSQFEVLQYSNIKINYLNVDINRGSAWLGHLAFAYILVNEIQPDIIVELGTHYGDSYFAMCQSVYENKLQTKSFAVDTWKGDPHSRIYDDSVFSKVISINDTYKNFSVLLKMHFDDALDKFDNESIDILHIDGYHTYESVKHDFETWLPKVKKGGIVLLHDVNEYKETFGAHRLWDEIKHQTEESYLFRHSHGLGVWRKHGGNELRSNIINTLLRDNSVDATYIDSFVCMLADRNIYYERYKLSEEEKNQIILSNNKFIEDTNIVIKNQNVVIKNQSEAISRLDKIGKDTMRSLDSLHHELNLIYSTKGYRLLQSLRRVLRVLLPANSIRRKVVKYFIYKPLKWIYKLIATIYNTIMKLFKCCFSPLFILQYKISSYYRRYGFLKLIKKCFTYPFDKIFSQRHKMRELYERYAKIVNLPDFNEIERQSNVIFGKKIKFSIITPLYNTDEQMLKDMLNSVINQTYNNWELCLVDGSDDKHHSVKNIVMKYADADDRIRYNKLPENLGISGNSNKALEMSTGDYIALLDHDDVLHPSALFMVMEKIEDGADFIYSDEAIFKLKITDVYSAHFKPDFSVYNLRANNYICHFTIFSRKLYELVGGFREEFNGSQDHDLVLRLTEIADKIVHIPMILYFWRNHPGSVASSLSVKQYAVQAGVDAVQAHLDRIGLKAKVDSINNLSVYRVRYEISGNPKISIIIPNKDLTDDLKKCINSILKYTTYNNYEIIIVENNSVTNEIFDYYKEVEKLPNIKVIFYHGEFNYSKINNFAIKYATGDYFLFLNNDIEIITKEWIEEMLMLAQYNDVGVVGIKLYYPDNSIQHGGVILLGPVGVAGHSHYRCHVSDYGYMFRLIYVQEYSAVTAACMMVKKDIFIKVNGFEEDLTVAFNDVDLCLKIREAGYKIIWTPFSEAYHHESKSRGYDDIGENKKRFMKENEFMFEKWGVLINNDPFYNQNLSLLDSFQIK